MESDYEAKLQDLMDLVNFGVKIRALIFEQGFTEVWVRNPETGAMKRIWVLMCPN